MSDTAKTCPDCVVLPGELHTENCDVERCPDCGGQMFSCMCTGKLKHPRMPWTGEWPDVADCRELDFWCYWGPSWVRCDKDHPDAREDLNRLHEGECKWNADTQKWELRKQTHADIYCPRCDAPWEGDHAEFVACWHCGHEFELPDLLYGAKTQKETEHVSSRIDLEP